jgi:hypothetical protein
LKHIQKQTIKQKQKPTTAAAGHRRPVQVSAVTAYSSLPASCNPDLGSELRRRALHGVARITDPTHGKGSENTSKSWYRPEIETGNIKTHLPTDCTKMYQLLHTFSEHAKQSDKILL